MLSVAFMLQDPGDTAYPRPFMWFLSNCIIWSEATGRRCPSAPTLLSEKKSKYLAVVNRDEMRSLTFLQERSHNTSIRRMPDRAGRATVFHKFFFYTYFSDLSSLSSWLLQLTRLWHAKHHDCRGKVILTLTSLLGLGMKQFFQHNQEGVSGLHDKLASKNTSYFPPGIELCPTIGKV